MKMVGTLAEGFFLWAAWSYREGLYLAGAKLAGALCSFADIIMIWMFLRLRDEIHGQRSRRRRGALALFAALTPSLFLAETTAAFFVIQFAVVAVPYLILVWTALTEAPHLIALLRKKLEREKLK